MYLCVYMVYELERKTLDKTILKTIKQLLNKKKQEFSSSILCIFLLHQKLVIFNKVYRLVPFFLKFVDILGGMKVRASMCSNVIKTCYSKQEKNSNFNNFNGSEVQIINLLINYKICGLFEKYLIEFSKI